MTEAKKKAPPAPLKMAGGVLFLIAATALFIHRLPKHEYVQAHADKPRVVAKAPAAAPAAAPAKAPVKPLAPGAKAPAAVSAPAPAAEPGRPAKPEELEEACTAESGILCYRVGTQKLRKCLGRYQDVLLKNCRTVFEQGSK